MAFTFRAAHPDDLNRCLEIEQASFATPYTFHTFRQFIDVAGELFIVVAPEGRTDSQVVGYGLASMSTDPDLVWALNLAVDRPYRRRGLGHQLTLRLLHGAEQLGASRVRCTVSPDNLPMRAELRSLNFSEVDEDPHYFGLGEARKVMEYAITHLTSRP